MKRRENVYENVSESENWCESGGASVGVTLSVRSLSVRVCE